MERRGFKKKELMIILAIFILIVVSIPIFIFPEIIGNIIREQKNQVQFYFYEENGCPLNGYVFIGDKLVGKSENGYFNLAYENYLDNFNAEDSISLFGKLGPCFGGNSELFFDKYWKLFKIEKYYFDSETVFNFKTNINPHNPAKRELLGFIQPEKVESELNEINLRENTLTDLSNINQHLNNKIGYIKDWEFTGENYWQTPLETLELGKGDCEDYSSTLLSLFFAHSPSLNCYNVIFSSHVTTFCYVQDYYVYYDQEKTELKKQVKDKNADTISELTKLKEDYFKHYGINNTERAHYAFNNNQFIEFKSEEEFINWQYYLGEKQEFDLFEQLEQQTLTIEEKYPIQAIAPMPTLATQRPTLKSFIIENLATLVLLTIVFLILVLILIIINIRK